MAYAKDSFLDIVEAGLAQLKAPAAEMQYAFAA